MKNLFSLLLVLGLGLMLPACRKAKDSCCSKTSCCQPEKRVSGPLSDKEVGWDANDRK